jgi:hypothetical protein
MERKNVKRVPVLGERANLLHALVCSCRADPPVAKEDSAIREQILLQLATLPWRPTVTVAVRNGVVNLAEPILNDRERRAVRVAVENEARVKAIHDHVVWVEPNSGMANGLKDDGQR